MGGLWFVGDFVDDYKFLVDKYYLVNVSLFTSSENADECFSLKPLFNFFVEIHQNYFQFEHLFINLHN